MTIAGDLRELACRLAVDAGTMAAEGRRADIESDGGRLAFGASTKSSATDVVTRHDRAAEAVILDGLIAARPDDAVIGEEGTNRAGTSEVSWYIDPIDGTSNFFYGLPMWSTSVAAVDAEGGLAGAVYIPATAELFSAARGEGATRNDVAIAASAETDISLALVATGFGYSADARRRQAGMVNMIAPHIRDIRRMGSAAIDLAYTAAGFLDAYWEEGLNMWDMAAGELIAREAGCRSGNFAGGAPTPAQLLVAGPGVYDAMVWLLSGAG